MTLNRSSLQEFQYPIEIPGISNAIFLQTALNEIRKYRGEEELTPKELGELREPLFCSNIIAVAYRAAGYKKPFSKVIYDTWPRDFIISPNTEKICRIEYT